MKPIHRNPRNGYVIRLVDDGYFSEHAVDVGKWSRKYTPVPKPMATRLRNKDALAKCGRLARTFEKAAVEKSGDKRPER